MKPKLAAISAVIIIVIIAALAAILPAQAQDVPVGCFPCEPDPVGCAPCHK